jgi:DNA end-binding protein Ku
MATQLLDAMMSDWDPRRYHDTFTEELRERIEAKDRGEDIVEEVAAPEPTGKVVDLMAALEASVDAAKRGGRRRTKRRKTA